jgi:phosphate transport system substrate-binding protein
VGLSRRIGRAYIEGERVKLNIVAAGLLAMVAATAGAQNITAAGATFPYPIYNKWFTEYNHEHPNVKINYQSIGSGGGIRQVSDGTAPAMAR